MNARSVIARGSAVDGIFLLDKPTGMSSNAALQRVKHSFGAQKAGHTGSLDPLASGMLPICLGEATKVAGALLGGRKRYQFAIALGQRTPSGDAESAVVEEMPVPPLEEAKVAATLHSFSGTRLQTPPMYSAVKHQGKPLYRLARRGIEVERTARQITLEDIELESLAGPRLVVQATCSKGTYIRSLAEEIAAALGTCGYVVVLRRLWSEPFEKHAMHSLEELEGANDDDRMRRLLPTDTALLTLSRVDLDASQAKSLLRGQAVHLHVPSAAPGRVRVYDPGGRFLGVASLSSNGELQPQRLVAQLVTPGVSG